MTASLKMLVIDDDSEIRAYLSAVIGSEFATQISEADCGQKAVQMLTENKYDLILCDFHMPDGDGNTVFAKVKSLKPSPKFIMVSSDDRNDHKNILEETWASYLEKPFENQDLIKMIAARLEIVPIDLSKNEFVTVPIGAINKNDILPFDIYLKLGDNHQVKYFNANRKLTDTEKDRLKNLKTNEVFVRLEAFQKFISEKQRTVFENLVLPKNGTNHKFEIQTVQQELGNLGLKKILEDKEIMDLTQKNLKTVFALSYKVKVFDGLLEWTNNSDLDPKKVHTVLITLFCNIILKNLKSMSYNFKDYLNLGYAALLHDLILDDYMVKNEFRLINSIKLNSKINKEDQEVIIEHVNKVLNIVNNWSHCPNDVLEMIANHHERPKGNGFPKGLTGDKVSILSSVFNVAHDVTDLIWDKKKGDELQTSVTKLAAEYKGFKHFEEPLEILIKEVLMK
jgi:response regulator RpfG family c-di-GMP phosphodiesterase